MKKIILIILLPFACKSQFCVLSYDQTITQGLSAKIDFKFNNTGCWNCNWDSIAIRLENYFIAGTTQSNMYSSFPLVTDSVNSPCGNGIFDSTSRVIYTVPYTAPSGGWNYYIDFWKQGSYLGLQQYPVFIYASAFSVQSIQVQRAVIRSEYYDTIGNQLAAPCSGINVVSNYYSDGSIERKKILIQ